MAERPLQGRVAVVTGSSRGVGRALVERLTADGAVVVGCARTEPDDRRPGHEFIRADVSREEDVRSLFGRVASQHGRLDILVSNAGIELEDTVSDTTLEDWEQVIGVNLTGPFLCAREAIPHMRRAGGGVIVNIGSIDSLVAEPRLAAYSASKAGLLGLTRSIAIDYGPDGIRCLCVCPTYIRTEMAERYYAAQPDPEAVRAAAVARHPLGRIAEPEDIAAVVALVVRDDAAYMSGQPIVVDGASLAWFGI